MCARHGNYLGGESPLWGYTSTNRKVAGTETNYNTTALSRKGNCLDNALMEGFFGICRNLLLVLLVLTLLLYLDIQKIVIKF